MQKRYKDYVCPKCFQQIPKCKCEMQQYSLIMVDEKIQPHVRTLQNKGYYTIGCCEGHKVTGCIYVAFAKEYSFADAEPLPEGFVYKKFKNTIYCDLPKKAGKEETEAFKAEKLNVFLKWCESLPIRTEI